MSLHLKCIKALKNILPVTKKRQHEETFCVNVSITLTVILSPTKGHNCL